MVKIDDHKNCCGCEACVQRCPKNCITLKRDAEGFLYPEVDTSVCIDCGLCEKVCPCQHDLALEQKAPQLYAYTTNDKEVLSESSSGGAFTTLAKQTLTSGGVVFGAAFADDWSIQHICVTTADELHRLRGSKYVQSHIGQTFKEAEQFLKEGRQVLYSGTPCQIKGLKRYLRKEYDNLLTVDFICHGVPSPLVWQAYLSEASDGQQSRRKAADGKNTVLLSSLNEKSPIGDITFRDKSKGWEKYRFVVRKKSASKADKNSVLLSDIHLKNPYMRGFLSDIYLRPSCYHCPAKSGRSGSDIQMADFWGVKEVDKEMYSPQGVSMLIVQTARGSKAVNQMEGEGRLKRVNEDIELINRSYAQSSTPHPRRAEFFRRFGHESFIPLVADVAHQSLSQQAYYWMRVFLKWIGINHILNKTKKRWLKK